ncbi:MAG: BamA/TamA family outer membrane protein [Thiotrichales bacterium]|nr:BamA/TamA family outer membrane protein [Thiotrichales bacterium]
MNRLRTISRALFGCSLLAMLVSAVVAPVKAQTPVVRFEVVRFEVQGDNPLTEARTREVLAPFAGTHAGVDGLLAAADALEQAIQDAGVPFQRVVLPPQSLQDGTVVLRLVVFTVTQVEVRGGQYHSEKNIRRSVPALQEGETPDTRAIARNLALANLRPWKTTNLTFRESETRAQGLDATLEVEDRRPRLLWSALDNTGNASTGPFRWSVGASVGNLFDRDHDLNASYVTSPGHASQVRQWAFGYSVPVYRLGGTLSGFYVGSDVDSGRVLNLFDVSGAGDFGGLLYTHDLGRRGRLTHRAAVGIEDRRFENKLVVAGFDIDLAPPPVRSRPVSIHYGAEFAGDDWGLDLSVRYARNLESGGGNDDSRYELNRSGAKSDWDVMNGAAVLSRTLPAQWTFRGLVEGQIANEVLLPGEQFGIGGVRSVRGFSERQVAGEDGIRGSLELWSPAVANPAGMRFLVFADAGRVYATDGPDAHDSIASIGWGLRWNWKDNVSLLLDLGAIVEGTESRESGMRGHLNLLVRY